MGVMAEDSRPNHSSVSKRLKCQDYSPERNNATEVPAPLRPRQPLAWQKQAQLQPRSAEIVTSGSQPAACSGHRLTSTGEIFAPSLRCCHHPDETDGNQAVSVHCLPSSVLMHLEVFHSVPPSPHPCASHTHRGSAGPCEFKQHCFPWLVAENWHYPPKILDHKGKDMTKRERAKAPGKFQEGRCERAKGKKAMRREWSPPRLRQDETSPLTDFTVTKRKVNLMHHCWLYLTSLKKRGSRNKREKVKEES